MRLFVSIAMIGERGRQLSLSKASELKKMHEEKDKNSVDNLLDIASDYSVVDGKECGVNVTDQAEATYLLDAEIIVQNICELVSVYFTVNLDTSYEN